MNCQSIIDETEAIRKLKQFVLDTQQQDQNKNDKIFELQKNVGDLTREMLRDKNYIEQLEEENKKLKADVQLYKEMVLRMCEQYC